MKRYERSLPALLWTSALMGAMAAVQMGINIIYGRAAFIAVFAVLLAVFVGLIVLITLDLALKDPQDVPGEIVHIQEDIISVLKPDGKLRRVKIPTQEELALYAVGQQVRLTIAKRTGVMQRIVRSGEEEGE